MVKLIAFHNQFRVISIKKKNSLFKKGCELADA